MLSVVKKFNGVKKDESGWCGFHWIVTIGDIDFEYRMGLGHSSLKRNERKDQIKVKVDDVTLRKIYSWSQLDSRAWPKTHIYINKPKVKDVLYSYATDYQLASGTFEDFCLNLGLDTDSRKALSDYLACQESGHKLMKLLGYEKLQRILEWEL